MKSNEITNIETNPEQCLPASVSVKISSSDIQNETD